MKRSNDDDVDVNSPLKPVDHPDLEDDRGLKRDDKEQRRHNEEEKDQKSKDLAAEPLHDADEKLRRCIEEEKDHKSEDLADEPLHDTASEDKPLSKSVYSYIQGPAFLDKMKEELSDPVDFQVILKCLHIYSRDIITKQELQLLVGGLLEESADLMKGFNDFLSLCENHQKWIEESC